MPELRVIACLCERRYIGDAVVGGYELQLALIRCNDHRPTPTDGDGPARQYRGAPPDGTQKPAASEPLFQHRVNLLGKGHANRFVEQVAQGADIGGAQGLAEEGAW
jgi:hypothetical protein